MYNSAECAEFSLDAEQPVWRIPATRMKMGEEHLVALARQAIAILREIEPVTGGGRYVFPSLRGGHRPISENTANVALRSMGYSGDQITGHGFRAMAPTCGVGRIYQQTFVDTYAKVAFASCTRPKRRWPRPTDRGTEYCGKVERHEFQLYLAVNDINHTRTKPQSPQTNGTCERFHKTILNEFY